MSDSINVVVQEDDFSLAEETDRISVDDQDGAVVTFVGKVRGNSDGSKLKAMFLEHYPGMTEKSIIHIAQQASQKWSLGKISVIHRVGELAPNEQIVFVGVSSPHRQAAFSACEYIMDYLKIEAPFWKKELFEESENWVAAKESDQVKARSWNK